jgi:hypothetical protein
MVLFLQAGYAIGLGRNAELVSVSKSTPVRLQVSEVLGPSTSKAVAIAGEQVREWASGRTWFPTRGSAVPRKR